MGQTLQARRRLTFPGGHVVHGPGRRRASEPPPVVDDAPRPRWPDHAELHRIVDERLAARYPDEYPSPQDEAQLPAAVAEPDPRTPLPVMYALTGGAFTAAPVYAGEAVGDARQRIADRLEKRPLQVVMLQNTDRGLIRLEDHVILADDAVQIILQDFPTYCLRHKENKPKVYFAASVDDAKANEFMSTIDTPHPVQLLEKDPIGAGGWALIRIAENAEQDLPTDVYVRQAHLVEQVETHIEPHRAPVVQAPDEGAVLLRVRHCEGRPDVAYHYDQQAAKDKLPAHGFVPNSSVVVALSEYKPDVKAGWCQVKWLGSDIWVRRAHIEAARPGESFHDGTVCISHVAGRADVVYHNTLEAAQAKERQDGKIPSGSLSTVIEWDREKGARGWAKLTWRGGDIFVKQEHVRIKEDTPDEDKPES